MRNVDSVLRKLGVSEEEVNASISAAGGNPDSDAVWKRFVGPGKFSEGQIFKALADVNLLEYVENKDLEIPAEVIASVPSKLCREARIIPLDKYKEDLYVATDIPNNLEVFDELGIITGLRVNVAVMMQSSVSALVNTHFRQDEDIAKLTEELTEASGGTDEEDEDQDSLTSVEGDSPNVQFVNLIIAQAIRDRASDIHVEPSEKHLIVRYRIDGVMHVIHRADKAIQRGVISRLKVMSSINIAEKRVPQSGRATLRSQGRSIDLRVESLPTVWGEKIVIRILDSSAAITSIEEMLFTPENEAKFRNAITKSNGIVLITGPTGSGKSSTLYTVLESVTDPSIAIVTVENPVERRIKGVSQVQVNEQAGMTFHAALRSILRADPDIILVGEIRDEETAKSAVDAAMTGHLVFSTLHTTSTAGTPSRLVELGVEPYLVGSTVSCVVAQRLARRLCSDCKVPYTPTEEELEAVGFPKQFRGGEFFEPKGCSNCSNIGYRGRVALTEVLEVDGKIDQMIISGKAAREIEELATGEGMMTLLQDGYHKVSLGITTIKEVLRVAK